MSPKRKPAAKAAKRASTPKPKPRAPARAAKKPAKPVKVPTPEVPATPTVAAAPKAPRAAKAPPVPKAAPAPRPPPAPPAPPAPILESVDVQAPAHRVWAALTSPDEVNRWLTERCEFEARSNGRVLLYWNSGPANPPEYVQPSRYGTAVEARVEAWEPRKSFTLRPMSHWPGTVTFRLEDIPSGTRVTVEHGGWPKKDDWYRSHQDGWADFLDYLRNYLEMPEAAYDAYVAKKEKASASHA